MKRIQSILIAAGAILVAGLIVWHFLNQENTAAAPQRIGVLMPLTGDASSYGQKGRKAIEMAVDDFNAREGTAGKRVAAIFEDSKGSPKDGVSAAQKLISVDKVPAIVGDALSSVTLPVAAVAEPNKVVLISPDSSAPALTQAGKYIYRIWPSDLAEGEAAAKFAASRGFSKVAIFHLNNDYGNAIADIFVKHFANDTRKVVLRSSYQDTTTDWRTIVTPLASAGADAVYIAGYYKDTAAILRTATELGIKAQFIGATAIEDENFIKLAGKASEGIVYPLASGFDAASTENADSKTFVEAFKKRFGYEPGWMEAYSYDAFMLVCKAIASNKEGATGTQIRDYFDKMGSYHGVTGDIKFDENGDVIRGVIIKTVKDGHFVSYVNKP